MKQKTLLVALALTTSLSVTTWATCQSGVDMGGNTINNIPTIDLKSASGAELTNAINAQSIKDYINTLLNDGTLSGDTVAQALNLIAAYADDQTQPEPTVADYLAAGVGGVDSSNLADLNSAVADLNGTDVDTAAEIQAIVDSFTPDPLPGNITITDSNILSVVASVYDTDYNVDLQGTIDSSKLLVKIPYTVTNASTTLPAYSKTKSIATGSTQDGESGIQVTLSWESVNLAVGSGTFNAYISIDDTNGNNDGVYNARKLDIDTELAGFIAASFDYATNDSGGEGTLSLSVKPGIPDRNFSDADHHFLYLSVVSPQTGKVWLNNNLGAASASVDKASTYGSGCSFNLVKQASAINDHCAYGSQFSWGLQATGYELMAYTSATEGSAINGASPAGTTDTTRWQSESGAYNVCPVGYRLPTSTEWANEYAAWADNAAASTGFLKISAGGYISQGNTAASYPGSEVYYNSATTSGDNSIYQYNVDSNYAYARNWSANVRCIKN